jgi:aspartate/methionine/tyrosine aminotransferase
MRGTSTLANSIERSGIRDLMDLAREMSGPIVHLEVGEPNFITPAHIIEAAFEQVSAGATHYTPSTGIPTLRKAIAERYSAKWDKPVSPQMTNVAHGGVNAINSTVLALINAGDEVLVPDPGWPNYRSILSLVGAKSVLYPMTIENGYEPDRKTLEALITSKTRMIITCNPGNPTGAVWSEETVRMVLDLARKHDLYVLSDEIYEELVFEGEHVPAARFDDDNRVITVSGFSKTYAMTGWRLGWAIAAEPLIAAINKMMEPLISCASSVSQVAGVAALTGPQDAVAAMREAYCQRRDIAASILEPAGMLPVRPHGAFYAIVDLSKTGMGSRQLALDLLSETRVACAPGDTFGYVLGGGYVRISLASSDDDVREGCERIVAFRDKHAV